MEHGESVRLIVGERATEESEVREGGARAARIKPSQERGADLSVAVEGVRKLVFFDETRECEQDLTLFPAAMFLPADPMPGALRVAAEAA